MITPPDRSGTAERRLIPVLFGLTLSTGMVDAVSFLGLGHVFTANMTGNVVFLGFALAGAPGLSIPRSALALGGFLTGAMLGGRLAVRLRAEQPGRRLTAACCAESALLFVALATCWQHVGDTVAPATIYAVITLTALAMGVRNAVVRDLAVPDMTTTVLTLTITGLAADSTLAGGQNPRWSRRMASILFMSAGAALGAWLLRYSLAIPLIACASIALFCAVAAHLRGRGRPTIPA
jgi:uncharacterized membrane protein YoaK (UPF0700 family)